MIDTLVFDFGNVIGFFDHQRAVRRLAQFTVKSAEELTQLIYYGDLEVRYECGLATTSEVFEFARSHGGISCTESEFVDCYCDIFWPNPPMQDLIPRLKSNGYRIALGSNTNDAHFNKYSSLFESTLTHFDVLGVSHFLGARKPTSEFFSRLDELLSGESSAKLFVDDMPENVAAAEEFGWDAVLYTSFDSLMLELLHRNIRIS